MESLMGTPTGPLVEQIDGIREHDIDSIGQRGRLGGGRAVSGSPTIRAEL